MSTEIEKMSSKLDSIKNELDYIKNNMVEKDDIIDIVEFDAYKKRLKKDNLISEIDAKKILDL